MIYVDCVCKNCGKYAGKFTVCVKCYGEYKSALNEYIVPSSIVLGYCMLKPIYPNKVYYGDLNSDLKKVAENSPVACIPYDYRKMYFVSTMTRFANVTIYENFLLARFKFKIIISEPLRKIYKKFSEFDDVRYDNVLHSIHVNLPNPFIISNRERKIFITIGCRFITISGIIPEYIALKYFEKIKQVLNS